MLLCTCMLLQVEEQYETKNIFFCHFVSCLKRAETVADVLKGRTIIQINKKIWNNSESRNLK